MVCFVLSRDRVEANHFFDQGLRLFWLLELCGKTLHFIPMAEIGFFKSNDVNPNSPMIKPIFTRVPGVAPTPTLLSPIICLMVPPHPSSIWVGINHYLPPPARECSKYCFPPSRYSALRPSVRKDERYQASVQRCWCGLL